MFKNPAISLAQNGSSQSTPTTYYQPPNHPDYDNAELRLKHFVEKTHGVKFDNYYNWWRWTCDNPSKFWRAVLEHCEIKLTGSYTSVLEENVRFEDIPKWFIGAQLNYTENCLRWGKDDAIAFIDARSADDYRFHNYRQLRSDVHFVAEQLKQRFGIERGDRICAYAPNCYETAVAMLASASLGAVWSSASLDFGPVGVLDRFSQIKPKLLFAAYSTSYRGRFGSLVNKLKEVINGLPTLKGLILLDTNTTDHSHRDQIHPDEVCADMKESHFPEPEKSKSTKKWKHSVLSDPFSTSGVHNASSKRSSSSPFFLDIALWSNVLEAGNLAKKRAQQSPFAYEQVPFNHPLYILFSSGTTGRPKCMVHTVGGTLLKHVEEHCIQTDTGPRDRVFFYTTCGWMMWNWIMSILYTGASLVLFDEHPLDPDPLVLMRISQNIGATVFGAGARIFDEYAKLDRPIGEMFNLDQLRLIISTASPLKPSTFEWLNTRLKPGIQIGSASGGTDLVGCFMGPTLNRPVVPGQCQYFVLGMDCCAFNEQGEPVYDERAELVCRRPFPSMPSHFLNDPDGKRYRSAYFEKFPGVWTHGDFCEVNSETGGIVVYGRSDTTLNRGGVRIGTAEIYNVVEHQFPVVLDSLVVGQVDPNDPANELILMFLVLKPGAELTEELISDIKTAIKEQMSPRHSPNRIYAVPDIPYTSSGKKVEIAVKQVLHGEPVANVTAIRNPETLDYFKQFCVVLRN